MSPSSRRANSWLLKLLWTADELLCGLRQNVPHRPAPLPCHRQDRSRRQRDTPMTVPGRNRGTPSEYDVKTPVRDVAAAGTVSTSYTREADVTSYYTISARFAEDPWVFALTVMTRLFHIARVIPSPVAGSWREGFIGRLWVRFASPFTE